jgi:hypothetical protein
MGQAATQLTPRLPDQRSDATLAPSSLIELKPEPLSAVSRDDLTPLALELPQLTEEELDLRENARRSPDDCARTDRLFLAAATLTTAALGVGSWWLLHLRH